MLEELYYHAVVLISLSLEDPAAHAEEIQASMRVLVEHLQWVQLPPVAMGSGRCSLNHKAHALIHGTRMVAQDWPHDE